MMAKKVFKSILEIFEENDRLDFIEGWKRKPWSKKKKQTKLESQEDKPKKKSDRSTIKEGK